MKRSVIILIYMILLIECCCGEKGFKLLSLNQICPSNYKSLPIVQTVDFKNENGKVFVNMVMVLNEDSKGPLKFVFKIDRCNGNKKCTTLANIRSNKYCEEVTGTTNPLSILYRSLRPEYKCPLHKGTYKATNVELDLKYLSMLGLSNGLFKIKQHLYDISSSRLMGCTSLEILYEK